MNHKTCSRLLVPIVALLLTPHVWARQASPPKPSKQIINAITTGDWNQVRTESIAWASRDPRSEIALFLADVSTSVTRDFDTKFKILTNYDYPYSEASARDRIAAWVDSLLKANDRNANYLILKAALQIKGFENMRTATGLFEQAREFAPDNEFILINLGNSYGSANRSKDAKEVFDKVLRNNPSSAGALNGLGMLAMSRRDMTKALSMFQRAVKANGAGPMEWFNLGSLYYYQKRLQEARQALEKAIDLSPKMIEARFNLAGKYYALGRKSDCIKQLRRIVDIAPTSKTGTRARNNLRSLGG